MAGIVFSYSRLLQLAIIISAWSFSIIQIVNALPSSYSDSEQPLSNLTENVTAAGQHKVVDITIEAMTKDGILIRHKLHTVKDFGKLKTQMQNFKSEIELTISGHSFATVMLHLWRNPLVITKNFVRKYFSKDGKPIIKHANEVDAALTSCYFTGKVLGKEDSLVSLSLCAGVNGVVEIGDKNYNIQTVFNESRISHLWYLQSQRNFQDEDGKMLCGSDPIDRNTTHSYGSHRRHGKNRISREIRLPAGKTSNTRYIEMYVVMDHSMYRRSGSVDATVMRAINIVNYASALYRQLDIYIALVGVEVWNDRNKIPYAPGTSPGAKDPSKILDQFNKYRQFNINWVHGNDNGQLITAEPFDGGIVGRGSTNAICTQIHSGGVTLDKYPDNYAAAASTMAHELGHNLGMVHSDSDVYADKDCLCEYPGDPDFTDCIMHSSTNAFKPAKQWSKCNRNKLNTLFKEHNIDHCLKNVPEKLEKVGETSVCGNFFVESGEECDCGQPADCSSKCCDPTTCKLYSNATCATGDCCNLDTCSLRPKSYKCRGIQNEQCDLIETCSGKSEWCPTDTYRRDGTKCENQGPGYCYEGKCKTHNSQCQFIWGMGSAKKSDDLCYEQLNNDSLWYGNCGWKTVTEKSKKPTVQKKYLSCKTNEDKFCGLLHCQHDETNGEGKLKNFPLTRYYQHIGDKMCAVTSYDVGYQVYDPGQVPNGAKCGENRMCVNSRCLPIREPPKECHCSGRGVCNQFDQCHCDIGWAPPLCDSSGLGGSTTSNPPVTDGPVNIELIAGLVAFFCGVVPMVIVLVLVAYFRRNDLRKICRSCKKSKPVKTSLQSQKSRELFVPLNQKQPPQAVANNVYYEGVADHNISNRNTAVISNPVLQSTTNDSSQTNGGVRFVPSRTAPPPPPVHSTRLNAYPVKVNQSDQRPKPEPPAKPFKPSSAPPKPLPKVPAAPPKVLPKPPSAPPKVLPKPPGAPPKVLPKPPGLPKPPQLPKY